MALRTHMYKDGGEQNHSCPGVEVDEFNLSSLSHLGLSDPLLVLRGE